MRVCYFGSYNPLYSRNKIIIDGLEKNGVTIFHCRSTHGSIFHRYPELVKKFWVMRKSIDVFYVGFVGHLDMPLAWVLSRLFGKKVVFDMFYSMYDTYVYDRQSAKSGSFRALSYQVIDRVAAVLADIVITDTKSHAQYFIKTFKLKPEKFRRIFVGGDDAVFKPLKKKSNKRTVVEFHGMFTRLHGAEHFVEAAKLLENWKNIEFLLIGSTNNYLLPIEMYKKLKPKNMKYIPELPIAKLAEVVARSDICVGHIGSTIKAKSVITNKMFQGLASKTAVIAGDCAATRELLKNNDTALFVSMGNAEALKRKILYLVKNKSLRNKLANNGYMLHEKYLTNYKLGKSLVTIFNSLI